MKKRIAVRIASFMFALCLLVTGGLIPSFAAGGAVVPAGGKGKYSYKTPSRPGFSTKLWNEL